VDIGCTQIVYFGSHQHNCVQHRPFTLNQHRPFTFKQHRLFMFNQHKYFILI